MNIISKDIQKAVEILNKEELVAIPTETVYGLAGNIYSEKAVRKIFAMKNRPLFNPLIVHIHSIHQLDEFVSHVPSKARLLANTFWPGSLTMVLKKKPQVPDLITAGKDSVAVRIPNHPVTLALLEQLNFPLAAPSANPFGCISPTTARHVEEYFGNKLQMVLDGGSCQNGIESTIIGFEHDEPVVYRLGAISLDEIEKVVGPIAIKNKSEAAPEAPGMLARHYAPTTTTYLAANVEEAIKSFSDKKIGLLLFCDKVDAPQVVHQEVLSQNADLKEAAANLYAALHLLDKLNLDIIIAERLPDVGLGKSINDRLERATKK
ncbi:threonylcarbamoyl-AMP synthase [Hymenobacter sp. BT664]|uniref:Threonylcarbamoyl-AMP synthase n=1 Tax=Hymenobacter montanus TaxID=2771359 RepID=A0A927B9U1_9BACT|nr:L-threonylcarbamoyladenylate synthase [Hymenobacter montanus]MBD2766792.1 threonylcarbamoyl-AMP synthase [Hymenobacter montanus]